MRKVRIPKPVYLKLRKGGPIAPKKIYNRKKEKAQFRKIIKQEDF